MSFTDEELMEVKDCLKRFGVDPGIDVCNYFEDAAEIASLISRLEAAEKLISCSVCDWDITKEMKDSYQAWLKSKGESV